MRVIYLGSFRFPNFDAAAARVLNIARALRELGHDVSFISWGGEYRKEDLCEDGVYRYDSFPYIMTNELTRPGMSKKEMFMNKMQRGEKTRRLLKDWSSPIDVIITYNNSLCRWLIPFCEKRGVKLINDITEWYDYNELKITDWMGYAYDMHVRQKKVKNKIVISSYLYHFYGETHNIVVPAISDASEPKWHENMGYAKAFVKPFGGITLIYAGTPAKKDAMHHVVNAVHRLNEEGRAIRFLVIGTTRESYLSRYASLLHTKDLHGNIKFQGRVSQDVIPSFYHQADFMVLLRDQIRKSNAGFPTKFTESFTSGTPIIANLTSDLGKYLKDGETGFVVEEPTEDAVYRVLKEKVMSLNREKVESMKNNVHNIADQLDYRAYVEPLRTFMLNLK